MNDLSDEAKEARTRMIWATSKNENKEDLIQSAQIGWQECRRRAEVRETQLIDELNFALSSIEERERKAFEAGFLSRLVKNWDSESAWQAYKEQK